MEKNTRFISPAIFGLIILCFFLPFIAISCSGQEVASLSGFKLATGTTISNPMDGSVAQAVESNVTLMIGLLCAVVGLVIGIIKMGGLNHLISACAGVFGFVMLVIFRFMTNGQINGSLAKMGEMGDFGNMLKVEYKLGFWLSLILFLAAAGYNGYHMKNKPSLQNEDNYNEIGTSTSVRFCSSCGAKQESTSTFCSECGAKL